MPQLCALPVDGDERLKAIAEGLETGGAAHEIHVDAALREGALIPLNACWILRLHYVLNSKRPGEKMDFFSTQNILVHIPIGAGGYDLSWIEAVGTLAGLLCIWLASRRRFSNYAFGLINVTLFAIIFIPDPAVRQPAFAAVLLCRQYLRLVRVVASEQPAGGELQIRWLPLPNYRLVRRLRGAIGLMTVYINPVIAFLTRVAVSVMSVSA